MVPILHDSAIYAEHEPLFTTATVSLCHTVPRLHILCFWDYISSVVYFFLKVWMEKTIRNSFALVFKIIKKSSTLRIEPMPNQLVLDLICSARIMNVSNIDYYGEKMIWPQKFLQKLQSYCCEKKAKIIYLLNRIPIISWNFIWTSQNF